MIALEIAGLVEVRGGAGAFVKNARQGALAASARSGAEPLRSHRRAQAAGRRDRLRGGRRAIQPDDLQRLEQSIEEMRADIDAGRDSRSSDRVFHVRLAEATRNAVPGASGRWHVDAYAHPHLRHARQARKSLRQ